MKTRLLFGSLLLLAVSSFADVNAAPVALSGWTTDDIVGASEGAPYSTGNVNGFSFYQQGLPSSSQGFPAANNGTLAPAGTTGTVFQFAPYAGNNADILFGQGTATLNLVSPHQYSSLQFLDVNQFTSNWNVTLHFAGGSTTTTSTFTDSDWTTPGAGATNGTLAFTNYGLVNGGTPNVGYTGYLYAAEHDIALSPADQAKVLTSITITNTAGSGNLMFLALSGQQVPEPSSMLLCGLGAIGLVFAGRHVKKAKVVGKGAALIAVLATLLFAPVAQATSIDAVDITNNNTNSGYDVGWAFTTSVPIYVTDLGKFVIGGTTSDSEVGIYQNLGGSSGGAGALLVSGIVPASAAQVPAGSVDAQYVAITPHYLPAGSYVIFDRQGTELFAEHATGTYGPGISFVAGVATNGQSSSPLPSTLPLWNVYNTGPDRYFGPTFQFTSTPEPGTFVLAGLGAIALFAVARRRRRA